jgi:hypothetical protein
MSNTFKMSLVDPTTKRIPELEARCSEEWQYELRQWQYEIFFSRGKWYYKEGVFPKGKDEYHDGIRSIYGLTGAESIPVLQNAIAVLSAMDEEISEWEYRKYEHFEDLAPSRKNAIKPLYALLAGAQKWPDRIWQGR